MRLRPSFPPVLPLLLLSAALLPARAHAICTWTPGLTMAPASGSESHGFDFTWAAVPGGLGCTGFTIDHYRVNIKESGYPTPATGRVTISTGTAATALPHRAQRKYYAKIYACDNATCTDKFGDGAGEVIATAATSDDKETDTTATEEWLIVGRNDPQSGLGNTIVDNDANDISSFFYPTGWTHADKLALYAQDSDGLDLNITYTRTTGTGWQNFNTATFETYVEAAGSHVTDADYDAVSHAYVFPLTDGGTEYVRLLAQNFGGTAQVVWADSMSDVGDNFGLTCASCCLGASSSECDWPAAEFGGTAGIAVCADGSMGCYDFVTALHGRWMWDYVVNAAPDLASDQPSILFTGEPDNVDCPASASGLADIYRADWSTSTGEWVVYDGPDAGSCPDAIIDDSQDPGITPLPNGEFKVYVVDASHTVRVHYYDGSTWETITSSPTIRWDDGLGSSVDHQCLANLDTFAHVDGTPHEGLFTYIHTSGTMFEGFPCANGTSYGGSGSRVYFAELQN